ncbi:TPA: fimbrial biogenesis outer membrane usher protein [Enterobacter chengduensis]|nr:fimbrial biogenesis outer membrane usher protein [Enterobacter chengduensis]
MMKRINIVALFAGGTFLFPALTARPADYYFSADELENTAQTTVKNIDVTRFNSASNLPGVYAVSVSVNGTSYGKMSLKFVSDAKDNLAPRLSQKQCRQFALNMALAKDHESLSASEVDIQKSFPGSQVHFDFNHLSLAVNIPQIYLVSDENSDFSLPPSQWDNGIAAAILNYDISGSQIQNDGGAFQQGDRFLKLNGGLNMGAWRLRSQGTLDKPQDQKASWSAQDTWLQRDIPALRGTVYLGNRSTDATLFDGFSFTGLALSSADKMLSDRFQGYAPVVRGIARTANARVRISQNGNVIYQSYVPAGAFEIKDIYPQSGGGELLVSIKETDGSEHHFYQPWGSVSVMQRPGHLKYSLAAGRYDNDDGSSHPRFYQASLFYGIPQAMTAFGGLQVAEGYTALDPGWAFGLGVMGAISADLSLVENRLARSGTTRGKSYRLQYAATVPDTRSDISLSWAVSPDRGYLSFADAVQNADDDEAMESQKSKVQITVNQPLADAISLAASLWQTEYWHTGEEKNLSLSYNQFWHNMTFSAGWSWTKNEDGSSEQQLVATIQIPLSALSDNVWLNAGTDLQKPGKPTQSLGLNGDNTVFDDELSWNVGATQGGSGSRSLNASADLKASHGEYQASYSDSADTRNLTWRAQGALLGSAYGLAFGQPLESQDTIALVRAPNAADLKVENNPGVMTDSRGMAIVSGLQPYRDDPLSLQPDGMRGETVLENTQVHLVPTDGAVVLAQFVAHTGKKVLVVLHRQNGTLVPFGATATAGGDSGEGIVDDRGQVFLSGVQDSGRITASWGDPLNTCHSAYQLPPRAGKKLYELNLTCA